MGRLSGFGRNRNGWAWLPAVLTVLLALGACGRRVRGPAEAYKTAELAFRNGEFHQALTGARLAADGAKGTWRARLRLLEAQSLLATSRVDSAASLLKTSDIADSTDPVVQARRRMLEGALLARRGKFPEAHSAFEEAFTRAERAGAVQSQIETELSRAMASVREGDLSSGDRHLAVALDLATRSRDRYHQAAALLNTGLLAAKRFRFDEAALILERVLLLCDQLQDAAVLRSAAMGNLAMCYSRLGNFERSREIRHQAIEFQQRAGLVLYLSQSFGEMGVVSVLAGSPAEAVNWFRKASDVAASAGDKADQATWQSGLAQAQVLTGNLDDAERAGALAATLRSGMKDDESRAFLELTRARIAAKRRDPVRAAQILRSLLNDEQPDHVLWEAHAELARAYRQLGKLSVAREHNRTALAYIDKIAEEVLRPEFRITYRARLIAFYQDVIRGLVEDGADARALAMVDAVHARVLAERLKGALPAATDGATSHPQIIAQASGATLLSYWISPTGSYVWVITPNGVHRQELADATAIGRLVAEHAAALDGKGTKHRLDDPTAPAARLYEAVVRPIQRWLPKGTRVVLVPDGPLHNVNFETLIVSGPDPHYWIEDATVSIAPSLALLRQGSDTISANQGMLLLGDAVPVDPAFPKLRFAGEELDMLGEYFPGATRLSGPNATPSSCQRAIGGNFSAIHFAAHAEANSNSPLDSAIILSPENARYKLYSRDIGAVPVRASLVTLSACRSAGARAYSGEGLVGFVWSFLGAGATDVVAGLWDVSDRSTAKLMQRFYGEVVRKGLRPAEALREAKLSLLRSNGPESDPWHWGPFQVYSRTWTETRGKHH